MINKFAIAMLAILVPFASIAEPTKNYSRKDGQIPAGEKMNSGAPVEITLENGNAKIDTLTRQEGELESLAIGPAKPMSRGTFPTFDTPGFAWLGIR